MTPPSVADWTALGPSLCLLAAAFLAVGLDLFLPRNGARPLVLAGVSGLGLLGGAGLLIQRLLVAAPAVRAFGGSLVLDDLAAYVSLAILVATGLLVALSPIDTQRRGVAFGEYHALVLVAAASMTLLVAANDFVMLFINLEILSLALYVLTGITRKNPRANEAAIKYLVTGAFATGFLLLGVAFLYGATGTLQLDTIGAALAAGTKTPLLPVGMGLVLVGFAFKLGAVPFHMWVPDVYEGAPTTTTAFMAVTVKAAGVGALVRVLLVAAPSRPELWADVLWWMAVATMIVGNLLAVQQQSVKRMLACSGIAHSGYALVALAAMAGTDGTFSSEGAKAALFYLFAYTFMTLGAFAFLVYIGHEVPRRNHQGVEWQDGEHLDDLAGLADRRPWAAAAMTVFMISLGGLPPTAGFVGKFWIFRTAVEQGHVAIAVIGVLASLVSLYYYLRVVVAMYMREAVLTDEKPAASIGFVVGVAAIGTAVIGIQPSTLLDLAARSIELLR